MFSFFLCRPFVVDFVDASVVAVFGLCVNYILIELLDSRTPTGFLNKILLNSFDKKEMGRQHQGMEGLEFAKSQRAVENRQKWRKLVVKSYVVSESP